MHSPATLAYFCAQPGRCFWQWQNKDSDFADLIDWQGDEKLIVLRVELEGILEALAPQGFPPLGALLLILDTLREDWTTFDAIQRLLAASRTMSGQTTGSAQLERLIRAYVQDARFIHELPKDLTSSGPARHRLLRTLFENHPDLLDPARSSTLLSDFSHTPNVSVFAQSSSDLNGIARLLKDLTALEKAFQRCPPEHLQERLRTGLDELPSQQLLLPWSQPDETPAPEPPADLLRALDKEGGELAQVAGIVRRMSALLHVPKTVTQREELPLGGVSDITNRGDPSRLLMTELAWDDLTFAVRLSQGEALYLRRESPPAEPPPRRLLLLDNGIFLWGKPRLFALGAAMALLRKKIGPQTAVSTVFTLKDNHFTPATLDTVDDIRTQLTRLEPAPNPGAALAQLHSADNSPFSPGQEVFLLTHPVTLEVLTNLPVWQKLAQQIPLHTLVVDRDGSLELARYSASGARVLAKTRVEADDLFEPPNKKNPVPESNLRTPSLTSEFDRLPRFYHHRPWPLYVPAAPEPNQVYQMGGRGFVGISTAGAVCWWTTRVHVGRVLAPNAPSRHLSGIVVDPESNDRLLILFWDYGTDTLRILIVDLTGQDEPREISYQGRPCEISNLRIQSGALVLTDRGVIKALSLNNGRLLASMDLHQHQGIAWFDGEKFQSDGPGSRLPPVMITTPVVPRPTQKIHRISEITRVGFGVTGGLLIQKEKGRTYSLEVGKTGTLEWSWTTSIRGHFEPLIPLDMAEWPECGLSQATFPDGRRIVCDIRGFLHVCDSRETPHELSVLLVKGLTTAWQHKGFCYGEPSLLWDESIGANSVLQARARILFRPLAADVVPTLQNSAS